MALTGPRPTPLKLSICITTFNRAGFIGATLESIIPQLTKDCEVVVLDGGSTDDTERVMAEYVRRSDRLRYVRQDVNNGFDHDCNSGVEIAHGEYCWLMTDDDLLRPGALVAVLGALRQDLSLIIVNTEIKDFNMSRILRPRWLEFVGDRTYGSDQLDILVTETGDILRFVGCLVVKRSLWFERKKDEYFGSLFAYLGIIFQAPIPGEVLVIAEPFITYRMGNVHTFSSKMFETFMVRLPSVVWSLALSESSKICVCSAEPWKNHRELLRWRGLGFYSLVEYRRWIRPRLNSTAERLTPALVAMLPGALVNAFFVFYYFIAGRRYPSAWRPKLMMEGMTESRFYLRNW